MIHAPIWIAAAQYMPNTISNRHVGRKASVFLSSCTMRMIAEPKLDNARVNRALFLGHFIGKRDLKRIRDAGAVLEGSRFQIAVITFCIAAVPGSLLVLVVISGI